jgi:tetratricopeptide (TPR) repeat protein
LKSKNRKNAVTKAITTAYGCKNFFNWTLMMSDNNYLQRAEKLIEISRFREAIPLLTKAYTQNPQNYQVICSLSYCFSELNDNDKSLQYAEKAITINPEDEWAYRLKTIIFFRRGKYKDALEYAEKAVFLEPDSESALGNLVYAYLHNEQTDEARAVAEELLEIYPDSAGSHYIYGLVETKDFNYAEAERYFRQALEIEPTYAEARNNLAIVVRNRANKENDANKINLEQQAFEHFNESVRLDPNNPTVIENLKIQFEVSGWIFFLIYHFPFILMGLIIHPSITLLISIPVVLIAWAMIQKNISQKRELSPELKNLLRIKDYKVFAKEILFNFVSRGKAFYRANWKQTLVAVTILLIYIFVETSNMNFWLYLTFMVAYLGNFFWMFSRMFHYTGPK